MDKPIGHLSNTNPRDEGLRIGAWLNRRRGAAAEEVVDEGVVGEEAPAPGMDALAELRAGYAEEAGETPAQAPPRAVRPTLADARRALAERATAPTPAPRRTQAAPQPKAPRGATAPSSGASLARGALGAILGKK
jgi:hypothetical protein